MAGRWRTVVAAIALLPLLGAASSVVTPPLTEAEKTTVAALSLSALEPLPPDPTNRVADMPRAAALGATLFFEQRLSRDGNVACATCHASDRQFQDGMPFGRGAGETRRRTMPLAGVARNSWFFWDGRRDSLWAQALAPLEDPTEHAGTRTAYAHLIAAQFRPRYERIFGPLPDLAGLPASAGPFGTAEERAAWAAMAADRRGEVDTVFANIGKAIAAFQRSIEHQPTRFDRFADAVASGAAPAGNGALTKQELAGLKLFIGKARCATCHAGPRFTDGLFHNTGVPPSPNKPPDSGREQGVELASADAFQCLGQHRDGAAAACDNQQLMKRHAPALRGAFKTPSLRGVAGRAPYMHAGQFATLDEVLDHYDRAPRPVQGHSEVEPLRLSDRDKAALAAFLRTL